MHAAMAQFPPPVGCILALAIVMGGMVKMTLVDDIPLPLVAVGAPPGWYIIQRGL